MNKGPHERQAFTFLVLCGGAGTRMGGRDKPLLPWGTTTMVDAVLASVPANVPKLISANRNLDSYGKRGRVVTDAETNLEVPSPLTGILSGLLACDTEWLLVAPGDTPRLQPDWYAPLLAAAGAGAAPAYVVHDGTRQQHLHVLLARSLTNDLSAYLGRGGIAAWRWLEAVGAQAITVEPADMFVNINTPQAL